MERRPALDLDSAPIIELERAAAAVLTENVHGYYATGARDGRTLAENEAAWGAWWFRPRRLSGVHEVSLATTLLGRPATHPIRKTGPFTRARAEKRMRMTAMIGIGTIATPIANGSTSAIA